MSFDLKESDNCRFDLVDSVSWLNHLEEYGYVVIKNVASDAEIATAKSLFWGFIEGFPGEPSHILP